METGIYVIRNTINNNIYIGSAKSFRYRWNKHNSDLRNNKHHSPHLQRAYNKYGKEKFSFEIIESTSIEKLIEREQVWLDFFSPEYNGQKIAGNSTGRIVSQATKDKMSEAKKGKLPNNIGYKWSEKQKANLKNRPVVWNKGMEMTEEHKEKLRKPKKQSKGFRSTKGSLWTKARRDAQLNRKANGGA